MTPIHARIRRYLNDQFLFEPDETRVPLDESLFGNGLLDSAYMVDIILFLENAFGISIPSTDIIPENLDTIDRMARYVRSRSAPPAAPSNA